ncbi:hypothetical protein XAUC_07850 [Xanthomonas citri pv. aurantifolii str. ICPB 10535]|nr:hypothetical protein XAUC_07850 [Xanthomonas citri pv. aurantifolii str. ICPB 10535]
MTPGLVGHWRQFDGHGTGPRTDCACADPRTPTTASVPAANDAKKTFSTSNSPCDRGMSADAGKPNLGRTSERDELFNCEYFCSYRTYERCRNIMDVDNSALNVRSITCCSSGCVNG